MWPQRGGDPQAENHCAKETLEKAQCVTSTVRSGIQGEVWELGPERSRTGLRMELNK